jgi:uncharacterized protein (TIGR03083 family)
VADTSPPDLAVRDYLAAIDAASNRLVEVLTSVDLDAPVPTCPDWTASDLVQHLGGIHRWAATYVREARTEIIDADLPELVGGWPPDTELLAWFSDGAARLIEALEQGPPDLECFTFLAAPSARIMWARRQAHETSIHRIDAEAVMGEATGFASAFAADGIDELTTAFITREGRGPRSDPLRTLAVMPTDHASRWLVHIGTDGVATERIEGPADATVTGTASDLYLWAWNRLPAEAIEVMGDRSLVERWRETVHVRWS